MKTLHTSVSSKRGFTLVETLVAIVVLMMSISGPLFIAQQSINSARVAQDKTTATFLAQEGMEYVRSVRDSRYLAGEPDWLGDSSNDSLRKCIGNNCSVDNTPELSFPAVETCGSGCRLQFNSSTHIYNHESIGGNNDPSKFTRSIQIEETVPDREARVTVEVSWDERGTTRAVTVVESILNWL